MLSKQSVFHVNQIEGSFYSTEEVKGYYNDLRGKVTFTRRFDVKRIPVNIAALGKEKREIYFPITVFQYGLGCYDVYLETGEDIYWERTIAMADWAMKCMDEEGCIDAFGPLNYSCKVSSMAQGEAASLLARAYKETGEAAYLTACKKTIEFMKKERKNGGTAEYHEQGLFLYEYPSKALVLNGWMFSAFGLWDCYLITGDTIYLQDFLSAVSAIASEIEGFDSGHWSYYDLGGKYTSPFYHSLHIELLKATIHLYKAGLEKADFPIKDGPAVVRKLEGYEKRWEEQKNSKLWARMAFVHKAVQKLTEKKSEEWLLAE